MRIDEILSFDRRPVATDQFRTDLKAISAEHPEIVSKLNKLIEFKRHSAPDQSSSKKDYILKYGSLHGYWHYHLIFGTIILYYALDKDQIRLIRIGPHSWIEGGNNQGLVQYISGLTPKDYTPFIPTNLDDVSKVTITDSELEKLNDTLYGLATDAADRKMLLAATKGNIDQDMIDYMVSNIDGSASDSEKWDSILQAFGGPNKFSKTISEILHNTKTI